MPYPESCPECGGTFRNTGTHFTARRNEVGRHVLLELGCQNTSRRFWWDFTSGSLSEDELRAGVHAAVQKQSFIPLFCASGEANIGVARLMDFIAKYGSSPVDREKVQAADANGNEKQVSLSGPDPVLYVFKTMSEAQFGELSFFRLYSGSVKVGTELYNSDRRITEKVGQIYILNGKNRTPVNTLNAGDIGAVVKLKDTHTGNTLCSPRMIVTLPKVAYPKPNVHAAHLSSSA